MSKSEHMVSQTASSFENCMYLKQKYKNTRNNYSHIFIVLDALKSLLCFPLGIDANDTLNYRIKYSLRKCCKKVITNKQDYLSTRVLILTFRETAINYQPELKTQLVLLDISTTHNLESSWSLCFKFCQMIYLLKTFIMI